MYSNIVRTNFKMNFKLYLIYPLFYKLTQNRPQTSLSKKKNIYKTFEGEIGENGIKNKAVLRFDIKSLSVKGKADIVKRIKNKTRLQFFGSA